MSLLNGSYYTLFWPAVCWCSMSIVLTICLCLALHCTADGRQPQGPALDSARQNLASTFVNAFVNAGFGQDKLVTVSSEAAGSDTGMRRSHHVLSWFSCGLARLCYVGNMLTVVRPHCLYRRHAPGINNSSCKTSRPHPLDQGPLPGLHHHSLAYGVTFCCAVLCVHPVHWIFKNKDHGKTSATASLGLISLWDVEGGLPLIDK